MELLENVIKSEEKKVRPWRRLSMAMAAGVFMCLLAGVFAARYSDRIQGEIAEGVIRFHVLANSDSPEDQALKLLVRDGVLALVSGLVPGDASREETREALLQNLDYIEEQARAILWEHGADYAVRAVMVKDYFPTRVYMGYALPAGVYEAVRVELGASAGHNWWCVMFPPLCLVDAAAGYERDGENAAGEAAIQGVLPEEAYDVVTGPVTVRFKVVELWQGFMHWLGRR